MIERLLRLLRRRVRNVRKLPARLYNYLFNKFQPLSSDYYFDKTEATFLKVEKSRIAEGRSIRRQEDPSVDLPWTGLALSGGGIRSATFSLGVIQSLARANLLKDFDYISTVSGGGYTGASLQWWWSATRTHYEAAANSEYAGPFGTGWRDFPYGPGDTGRDFRGPKANSAQNNILVFLRNHGSYLTTGDGINLWSGLAVVLRTVLLSILVWLPLACFAFFVITMIDIFITRPLVGWTVAIFGKSLQDVVSPVSYLPNVDPANTLGFDIRISYMLVHWIVIAGVIIFCFSALSFALLSSVTGAQEVKLRSARIFLSSLLAILLFSWVAYRFVEQSPSTFTALEWLPIVLVLALAVLLAGRSIMNWFDLRHQLLDSVKGRRPSGSYYFRRALERLFGVWFVRWLALLVISAVPLLPFYLASSKIVTAQPWHVFSGIFSVASGALSAFYGYYLRLKNLSPGIAGKILGPVGAAIFLFGTLTIAYTLAIFSYEALAKTSSTLITALNKGAGGIEWKDDISTLFLVFTGLAIVLGFAANVNHVGLHRYYRDRLMEAFMPGGDSVKTGRASYSPLADRLNIGDLVMSKKTEGYGQVVGLVPYPIINAFAFLSDPSDGRVAIRGGDNFIISPLFVGSRVTGWKSTKTYCEQYGPLSVASAMAVSGAAVNSNAGYIGTGVTRDRLVSAVMTILNMRLGIWVGNPALTKSKFRKIPTYIFPMLTKGLLSSSNDRSTRFVELSDGGGFENLGIYELVRRELDVIVAVDGEADSSIAMPGLASAVNRVKEDFGATIRFSQSIGPDGIVPTPAATEAYYPPNAKFSNSPFMLGIIHYKSKKRGILVYIKATLIKKLNFETYGYRAGNADFPHEGTVDQFFNSAQFEAYRNLGFVSGREMIERLHEWVPKYGNEQHGPVDNEQC